MQYQLTAINILEMEKEKENKNILKDFFTNEYGNLVNYVKKYFTDRFFSASAEDIVQDVALNVFSKLDLNAPVENLAGYFYRSVKNKIIDFQRKPNYNVSIENYTDEKDENIFLKTFANDYDDNENIYEDEEMQASLLRAIDKLNPFQQEIIIETEFEGSTFEELSKRWKIPIGTLLSRKHRAIQKLLKIFNEEQNEK